MKIRILNPTFFLGLILVSSAVSPTFAFDQNKRNLILIGVMALSPIIIGILRKFRRSDIWLILFMISIIFFPLANHPGSMRWSTVFYTIMFGCTFLAYKQLLDGNSLTIEKYQKILEYLIYAYCLVLLIQQFCVLTGLPIFNVSHYRLNEPWKLNSLTAEPSHSARIVALLMYCYITAKELETNRKYNFRFNIKNDAWVWLAFLWVMVTMGSGAAFIFMSMVLLKFIRLRALVPLFVIFGIIIFIAGMMNITAYERSLRIFLATFTLDPSAIFAADHSGAYRIVPIIELSKIVEISSMNGWFGHGVDYVAGILSFLVPGLPEDSTGGGMFQLWMDFGFISFVLFLVFSMSNCLRRKEYLGVAFWFMLVFIQGINSQIVWLTLILLFTNRFYTRNPGEIDRVAPVKYGEYNYR